VWGKTHLAIAITMAMAMAMAAQDQACRFFPATTLVQLLQKLDRNALLVIDVISYVRRSELETSVLFELICHRYERKSLLVTSNQPLREGTTSSPADRWPWRRWTGWCTTPTSSGSQARATGRKQLRQGFPANWLTRLRN
jgi:DNA replication protein DnaC